MSTRWTRRLLPLGMIGLGLASLGLIPPGHLAPRALAATAPSTGSSTGLTPADQPALNAAASAASAVAGARYFSYVTVNTGRNIVDVYLDHAPHSVISRLQAMHPGRYIFHNSAAHPESAVLKLEAAIGAKALSWAAAGVRLGYLKPTRDGYLEIGVRPDAAAGAHSEAVAAAASRLDAAYGRNWIHVVRDSSPSPLLSFRYNDTASWNGGDFIYNNSGSVGQDCTSGIPVHSITTGTEYMLTAAHCFWHDNNGVGSNGDGTDVFNGYVQNGGSIFPGSSATLIGHVTMDSNVSAGITSLDVALIQVSTSTVDFDAPWNSQGRAVQIGPATNYAGDQVCTSGAFDGQVCGLTVQSTDMMKPGNDGWGTFWVKNLAEATSSEPATVAAGAGDSGGPVYSYNGSNIIANGMIDHGDGAFVNCTSNPPDAPSGRICTDGVDYVEMPHVDHNWGVTPNT
jgi:hypothetical protein